MPTYDYLCPNGHRFEVIHSVTAAGPDACPVCGASPVRKAFSAPSIHFKGSGWAKKDRSATSRSAARSAAGGSDGSDAAPSVASGTESSDASSSAKTSKASEPKADGGGSGTSPAPGGDSKTSTGGSKTSGSAAAD